METCSIPFNYDRMNKIFKKPSSLKMLVCLVLAKIYSKNSIPIDVEDAKTLFDNNFKQVFEKYCAALTREPDSVLSYFKVQLKYNTIKNEVVNKRKTN